MVKGLYSHVDVFGLELAQDCVVGLAQAVGSVG